MLGRAGAPLVIGWFRRWFRPKAGGFFRLVDVIGHTPLMLVRNSREGSRKPLEQVSMAARGITAPVRQPLQ
eukprot:scaffold1867_cov247-Pinguiococcus_pyrenoidosus.AAC.25